MALFTFSFHCSRRDASAWLMWTLELDEPIGTLVLLIAGSGGGALLEGEGELDNPGTGLRSLDMEGEGGKLIGSMDGTGRFMISSE